MANPNNNPSSPSQDSQEVREALARLEAYCKALHEQGDYDGHLPWDESTERRDYVLIRDILLSALLSQSPKGVAGAREWVLMVENETGHIACGWKEMPKGVHSQPMSGCRYVRVREVLAATPSQEEGPAGVDLEADLKAIRSAIANSLKRTEVLIGALRAQAPASSPRPPDLREALESVISLRSSMWWKQNPDLQNALGKVWNKMRSF